MDVLLDDEELVIRDQARAFLQSSSTPELVRAAEKGDKISADLWREIVGLGWLETSLPETVDGLGLPISYLGLILEELGRAIAPTPFVSTMLALLALAEHGDAHRRTIDQARAGEAILCYAIQEPGGSWCIDDIEMSGEVDGDELVLTGTKIFVDDFALADLCLTAFQSEAGLSLALVDTSTANIVRTDLVTTAKDSEALIRFDGVRVPRANLVGQLGGAAATLNRLMGHAALFHAALLVGASRHAKEMAIEYVKIREAFEEPIGTFQAIQHLSADMAIAVDGAELLCREAFWKLGQGVDASAEIAQAKAFASEHCLFVTRAAHQMHGGIGFMMEFDLHLWYRRVISWSLRAGTAPEHRSRLADILLSHDRPIRLDGQLSLGQAFAAAN